MYVMLIPCNECAKIIIQSGIKEVVYLSEKSKTKNSYRLDASRWMFKESKVKLRLHAPSDSITIYFDSELLISATKN